MDAILILTYTAICVAVFKIFKIPLNKWTVPTAFLGGILLIGTLIVVMNYNHPYSEIGRDYFVTTPIVPAVTGTVIEVPVKGNVRLEKGDVLFRIDPTPFESVLNTLQAELDAASADFTRAKKLLARNVGSQRDLDQARARMGSLKGQISKAQFDLDSTTVRAPTSGYATQVALRPGMRAASLPLRPVMIFVHEEGSYFVAWFRQNSMLRLQVGDEAEVAYDGIPGKVFSGEVASVFPAIAEGQVQASGNLLAHGNATKPGRLPVLIKITDPRFEKYRGSLPGGAYAQAAIYTKHVHHVAIMRKVLLRMSAWLNYLFPFH